MPLIPRATIPAEGEAEAKLNTSYSKFLSESLHTHEPLQIASRNVWDAGPLY